jgi:hypothetical protein
LALRDGAVSAAQAGLFPDAIRLFEKAYAVLSSKGNHPALAVGVRIDIALTYWAAKRPRESLIAIADALDDVELLDPIASLQNERAHQYARAVIGVIWSDLDPYPSQDSRRIAIGQPSVLAGAGPLLKVDLKPLADNWRILALCEIEMGVDAGIEGRSQIKQTCPGLGSIELLIATARYARMVAKGEIELGFRYGLAAASAKRVFAELKASGVAEVRVTPAELESKSLQTLLDEGWEEAVWTVPLDLLVWRRFRGGWDSQFVAQTDAACLATWGSRLQSKTSWQRRRETRLAQMFRLRPHWPSDLIQPLSPKAIPRCDSLGTNCWSAIQPPVQRVAFLSR